MKRKGFSLAELVVAMGIMVMVFAIVSTTYILTQKLWKGGFTQIAFQSRGRIALENMAYAFRSSTDATIFSSGGRIRFVTDPNHTVETVSDDITSEYYISGTNIIYDPDVSVSNDEVTFLSNVYIEPGIPLFQLSDCMIVITFKLYNNDAVYGAHWSSMSTSVKMRNLLT